MWKPLHKALWVHTYSTFRHRNFSPYHLAVCKVCGSPPHTSVAPPWRCEPLWRRRGSRGCRGCRCPEAAPLVRQAPGGRPSIPGSDVPTQHPHLNTRDRVWDFWCCCYLYGFISGLIFRICPFLAHEYIYTWGPQYICAIMSFVFYELSK